MCIHTSRNNGTVCMDFTCLVDSNEPISSSRGSWGVREVGNAKLNPLPWNHEDAKQVVKRSWHKNKDNSEISPRIESFRDNHENEKDFEKEVEITSEYQHSKKEKKLKHMGNDVTFLGAWEEMGSYQQMNEERKNWHTAEQDLLSPDYFSDSSCHNELPTEENAIEVLKKNIKSLNKKIKQFEEDFENDFGYRPSHSEMRKHKKIKKYMSEVSKARKELKQMKDTVRGFVSFTSDRELSSPEFQPTVSCQETSDIVITLQKIEESLKEKRSACGRKENMAKMTLDELKDEKTSLQKALLYYESTHGRPETKEDRELAKPLYDRYRQCKRYVLRAESHEKENIGDLPPIIEHETMFFTQISPVHLGCIYKPTFEEEISLNPPDLIDKEACLSQPLGDLHTLSLKDLKTRKKDVREEKKRLRKAICDFEQQFEMENERKPRKEDRTPVEQTYLNYKYSKAKQRLIEALLTKLQPFRY